MNTIPRISALAFLLLCATGNSWAQEQGPFTYHDGLKIVRAYTSVYGPDAEELNVIANLSAESFTIAYTDTRGISANRQVVAGDRATAHTYVLGFAADMPSMLPGTTSLGISTQALEELRATGQTSLALMYDTSLATIPGTLTVVERGITMPLYVNTQVLEVPAMRATGTFQDGSRSGTGEFYFLDNRHQPVTIYYQIKFSWEERPRTIRTVQVIAGSSQQAAMQQTLETMREVDLYGIHFDFDKATLQRESDSLITDIAATLRLNPTWTILIKGHTDSIGDEAYNQGLSERRAAAVRQELIDRHGIDPSRLQSLGRGEADPVASNDDLQGRALNRRVELVRTDR